MPRNWFGGSQTKRQRIYNTMRYNTAQYNTIQTHSPCKCVILFRISWPNDTAEIMKGLRINRFMLWAFLFLFRCLYTHLSLSLSFHIHSEHWAVSQLSTIRVRDRHLALSFFILLLLRVVMCELVRCDHIQIHTYYCGRARVRVSAVKSHNKMEVVLWKTVILSS